LDAGAGTFGTAHGTLDDRRKIRRARREGPRPSPGTSGTASQSSDAAAGAWDTTLQSSGAASGTLDARSRSSDAASEVPGTALGRIGGGLRNFRRLIRRASAASGSLSRPSRLASPARSWTSISSSSHSRRRSLLWYLRRSNWSMRSSDLAKSPRVMVRSPTLATTLAACSGDSPAIGGPASTAPLPGAGLSGASSQPNSMKPRRRANGQRIIGRRSSTVSTGWNLFRRSQPVLPRKRITSSPCVTYFFAKSFWDSLPFIGHMPGCSSSRADSGDPLPLVGPVEVRWRSAAGCAGA
jgi:hypothetical protein